MKSFLFGTNLARRTNVIEINHWEKVANKTANINVQNIEIAQQYIDT